MKTTLTIVLGLIFGSFSDRPKRDINFIDEKYLRNISNILTASDIINRIKENVGGPHIEIYTIRWSFLDCQETIAKDPERA
jgi:hypothetical protein